MTLREKFETFTSDAKARIISKSKDECGNIMIGSFRIKIIETYDSIEREKNKIELAFQELECMNYTRKNNNE